MFWTTSLLPRSIARSQPDIAARPSRLQRYQMRFIRPPRIMLPSRSTSMTEHEMTSHQHLAVADLILPTLAHSRSGQAQQSPLSALTTTACGCRPRPLRAIQMSRVMAKVNTHEQQTHEQSLKQYVHECTDAPLRFRLWICRRFRKSENHLDLTVLHQTATVCRHRREHMKRPEPMILPLRRLSYSSDYQ